MRLGKLRRLGLLVALLALVATACAGEEEGGGGGQTAGEPKRGGTLRVVNEEDWDYTDTGSAYTVTSWTFARLYVRTLYSFDINKTGEAANEPVPDIAADEQALVITAAGRCSDNDVDGLSLVELRHALLR